MIRRKRKNKPLLEPIVLKKRTGKLPKYMRKKALKKRGLFYE